jgi:hypothetical protein
VQDETDGYQYLITVWDMQVHNGYLYVGGGFDFAGHVPAHRTAKWDGHRWCSVGGTFAEDLVNALSFYHDTLFVACGIEADGQPVNHVARFIAPEEEDSCGVALDVGVAELAPQETLHAYQSADGSLHFSAAPNNVAQVVISDVLGRSLHILPWRSDGVIPAPGLPPGVLLARLVGRHGEVLAGLKLYVP